ncbi:helix-turn-helix transcriptional regulator [Steroidobacter sp. S1-65]|uniref:Helix-turn-helix transcriptional regulator n=1 Tax=Steroidobacter gossypii TaxID=2805490 RepID=A0ABS1WWL1_9GAMM|nr:helix-turn-helix transcriptional regulator [Steroidobacter gossypii]
MDSEALVQLALNALSGTQKDLATKLNVSPAQISKWKKGEHMSQEMEQRLRAIANIGDQDAAFVLTAGSLEDAAKWERLMHYLAERAAESAETGYNTSPLTDEMELLCGETFRVLKEMGVSIPDKFPRALDLDYDDINDESWELLEQDPHSDAIYKIYKSLNDVYGFYAAYVSELVHDDDLDLSNTPADNIEPCLLSLAACKIEVNTQFAPRFAQFKYQVKKDYAEWLTFVKDRAFRAGVPLRAELLDLVYDSSDALGHTAEAESLGFNKSQLHPDIYMNELLVGMRMIHQVLPAIMKKLGIDQEFELDESKLRIG